VAQMLTTPPPRLVAKVRTFSPGACMTFCASSALELHQTILRRRPPTPPSPRSTLWTSARNRPKDTELDSPCATGPTQRPEVLRLGCGAVRDSTRGRKYGGTFGAKRTVLIDYLGDYVHPVSTLSRESTSLAARSTTSPRRVMDLRPAQKRESWQRPPISRRSCHLESDHLVIGPTFFVFPHLAVTRDRTVSLQT
jgi:hypothetical protein